MPLKRFSSEERQKTHYEEFRVVVALCLAVCESKPHRLTVMYSSSLFTEWMFSYEVKEMKCSIQRMTTAATESVEGEA